MDSIYSIKIFSQFFFKNDLYIYNIFLVNFLVHIIELII